MKVTILPGERESAAAREFLDSPLDDYEWLLFDRLPTDPPSTIHRHLPERGWMVYMLIQGDEVLYIGHTMRPRDRIKEHARDKWWWPHVETVAVIRVNSEFSARVLEDGLHEDHDPPLSQITGRDRWRYRAISREVLVAKALRGRAAR